LVFVASFPAFLYYAVNFISDAPAFGVFCLGLVFVLRGGSDGKLRGVAPGIALMAAAGLMKMTFAPYLAVPAAVRLRQGGLFTKRPERRVGTRRLPPSPLIALAVESAALGAQLAYIRVRSWVYAPTYFTGAPHPFRSVNHAREIVATMTRLWLEDLLNPVQRVVLAGALVVVAIRVVRRSRADEITVAMSVATAVMVGLVFLFGQQLGWHDYYAIAVFYPLASLLSVRLALELHELRASFRARRPAALLLLAIMIVGAAEGVHANAWVRGRLSPWWRGQGLWLKEAARALDSCGAECAGPVAVLGSEPPNLPLAYFDRQGIVLGVGLTGALCLPDFGSVRILAEYLDQRRLRVLVVKRTVLSTLPQKAVRRWFRPGAEAADVAVLTLRNGDPAAWPSPLPDEPAAGANEPSGGSLGVDRAALRRSGGPATLPGGKGLSGPRGS